MPSAKRVAKPVPFRTSDTLRWPGSSTGSLDGGSKYIIASSGAPRGGPCFDIAALKRVKKKP